MKKKIFEKSFVIVLFVLVMVAFALAERDTQKAFEKYNTKSTVKSAKQTVEYTADLSPKPAGQPNKIVRN
jgi:hypothetical protein